MNSESLKHSEWMNQVIKDFIPKVFYSLDAGASGAASSVQNHLEREASGSDSAR
jgi:hypothetical protein